MTEAFGDIADDRLSLLSPGGRETDWVQPWAPIHRCGQAGETPLLPEVKGEEQTHDRATAGHELPPDAGMASTSCSFSSSSQQQRRPFARPIGMNAGPSAAHRQAAFTMPSFPGPSDPMPGFLERNVKTKRARKRKKMYVEGDYIVDDVIKDRGIDHLMTVDEYTGPNAQALAAADFGERDREAGASLIDDVYEAAEGLDSIVCRAHLVGHFAGYFVCCAFGEYSDSVSFFPFPSCLFLRSCLRNSRSLVFLPLFSNRTWRERCTAFGSQTYRNASGRASR